MLRTDVKFQFIEPLVIGTTHTFSWEKVDFCEAKRRMWEKNSHPRPSGTPSQEGV